MYMMSVKLIWLKNRKIKYFDFIIQAEEEIHKCVSFSPDLLANISKESSQHIGIKIKKIKSSTKSDALQILQKLRNESWNSNLEP